MEHAKVTREVEIVNPQGIHARPADLFVKLAKQYQADITVVRGNERVDGKSILDMMTLAAARGTRLLLEGAGDDAEPALEALADLVRKGFGELEAEGR